MRVPEFTTVDPVSADDTGATVSTVLATDIPTPVFHMLSVHRILIDGMVPSVNQLPKLCVQTPVFGFVPLAVHVASSQSLPLSIYSHQTISEEASVIWLDTDGNSEVYIFM